jgi:ATP-binding protein involved in chromosome partitioning
MAIMFLLQLYLTTPACPMKDKMRTASENAIKILVNKEANVIVNFTANTTTKRLARR